MAFLDFPKQLLVKTIDTSEVLNLGGFQVAESEERQYARVLIYRNGTAGGSETLQVKTHVNTDFSQSYADSNVVSLSSVSTNLTWIRFDFNRENWNKNLTYYLSLTVNNYTRNADVFYLGVPFDFPYPVYGDYSGTNYTDHTLAVQLFGYK